MPRLIHTQELSLLDSIYIAATSHPTRVAFKFSKKEYTYSELFSLVDFYREKCERSQDPVIGILATQELETYAAILAILFSGKAFLPLNPKHPMDRNKELLSVSGTKTLFAPQTAHDFNNAVAMKGFEVILTAGEEHFQTTGNKQLCLRPPLPCAKTDLAYLFFTSGSTGKSKGVPICRGSLDHFFKALFKIPGFDCSADDRFLQMFDLTFDLANMSYLIPLAFGASVHPISGTKKIFLEVATVLKEDQITVALMVPSILTFLAPYFSEFRAPHLRLNMFCGEALDSRTIEEWKTCVPNARLWNVYGPTEATIFCSYYEIPRESSPEAKAGVVSIGQPMMETEFLVLKGEELTENTERGELCLLGPQVASGYWKDPERTEKSFPEKMIKKEKKRLYRTGDLVEKNKQSFFYIGRLDFQIKIDGYRVELGEIEYQAKAFFPFENVVVVPIQKHGYTRLYLYYQLQTALTEKEEKNLLFFLSKKLPPYMVPCEVHWKKEFPLNNNQKIDRASIHEA